MHKRLVQIVIGCVLLGALLTVLQIWTQIISWDSFFKIGGTLAVVILAIGFVIAAKSDFSEHKKLKDENYLD